MDDENFIKLPMAIRNIEAANPNIDAREYCISRLSNGLIKARAFRAKITTEYANRDDLIEAYHDHYKNDESSDDDSSLDFTKINHANLFRGFYSTEIEDHWNIPENFWHRSFLKSQKEWTNLSNFSWSRKMIWADWDTLEFDVISIESDGKFVDGDTRYFAKQVYVVGVSIEREAISSLFHNNLTIPKSIKTDSQPLEVIQNFQYDWLGAFAHIAARCRYDDVIEDINKRGVKSEIIGMMQDWFDDTQPKTPGQTILKEKADIVVNELKKQFGRSPL